MSERAVLRYGDPRLHQVSATLRNFSATRMDVLLEDMWDTMHARGGVGIAAPQIGEFVRVVVFGMDHSERYPQAEPIPRTVLINPLVEPLGDVMEQGWEACLSVPGMRGIVPRYREIRYQVFDQNGDIIDREVSGFHARVVQHECDHLDGILYPQRIEDMRSFGFIDTLTEHGVMELQDCDDEP